MQIISGIYKGKNLLSPKSAKTHPMGSREKLALFNMLSDYLNNAVVLDAYAGSGSLGLEALSRGAIKAVFIEKSPQTAKIIRQNAENILQNHENYEIITTDVKSFATTEQFDIILIDPPYDHFNHAEFQHLAKHLKNGGILALSMPKSAKTPLLPPLKIISERTYAAAKIVLYTH